MEQAVLWLIWSGVALIGTSILATLVAVYRMWNDR